MVAGIEWFRWHHGTTNDPKFRLVAKKAGARVSEVLSVWACLLEAASANDERGQIGTPDFEAMDLALDMDEGTAERIYARMCERDLVDDETRRLTAWNKRQPKRERDDPTATDRKRAQRARDAAADAYATSVKDDDIRDGSGLSALREKATALADSVRSGHATSRQFTPREEESREEQRRTNPNTQPPDGGCSSGSGNSDVPKTKRGGLPDCPHRRILALWAEVLPAMPQHNPDMWDGTRADSLRQRWRETAQRRGWKTQEEGLEYFRRLFAYVGASSFLTGKAKPREPGGRPFLADLEFIVTASKWRRLHDGKYEDGVEGPA